MKPIVKLFLLTLLSSGIAGSASAQIRDDESSQAVLAVQCAVSSGFSASDFEDYSRRLAKTLSLLTSSQQRKVFGYLPQPAAVSSIGADTTPAPLSPSQGAIKEVVKDTDPGLLVGLVGDLNNALSGLNETSAAVYAGEPASVGSTVSALVRGNTAGNLQDTANAIANTKKGGNSWDAIVSWLTSLAERARLR